MEEKKNSSCYDCITVARDVIRKSIPPRKPALEPGDLMVGDMVEYNGEMGKVEGICREEDGQWKVMLMVAHRIHIESELSCIQPIELTDEILKVIGKWDDEKNCYWINGFIKIRIVNNLIVHDDIILESLGDLQHLLKLYGVNVKII